jgi:hypothetical protein
MAEGMPRLHEPFIAATRERGLGGVAGREYDGAPQTGGPTPDRLHSPEAT